MNSRQLSKAMIARNGKKWNTKPERLFNEYQVSRGLNLVQNVDFPCKANGMKFTFQLDFARPKDGEGYDLDIEIDGKGHKRKWDDWKDEVKNQHGLRVIHIGGELCKKKWWPYLDLCFIPLINSTHPKAYIYE